MNQNRQQTLTQAASAHRDTLRKSLEHRIEIARSQGDEKLIRQLEAEASYLHLK